MLLKYKVWNPEHAEEVDALIVEAISPCAAAEEWAEKDDIDDCEYYIVEHPDTTTMCLVKPTGDGHIGTHDITYFRVRGERVNVYTADEV